MEIIFSYFLFVKFMTYKKAKEKVVSLYDITAHGGATLQLL